MKRLLQVVLSFFCILLVGGLPASGLLMAQTGSVPDSTVVQATDSSRTTLMLRLTPVAADDTVAVEFAIDEAFEVEPDSPALDTLSNSIGMKFVRIKAGSFTLGINGAGYNEKPAQFVTITKDFYLQQYETTLEQWVEIMESYPTSYYEATHPVRHVSWYDVDDFIALLNEREGCECYRLPTEAEWEYSARAGMTEKFFTNLDSVAWYMDNSGDEVHPVGQKAPNAWGLYDMYGNVWEWVYDWYDLYTEGDKVDPTGPEDGWRKSRRGGAFNDVPAYLGLYFRSRYPAEEEPHNTGFRLVRVIDWE